ncbi:selenocysteine-specific translation elongation factor [Clostridium formicaceticum]|uniref:Selenocysteine-specific elongation factor n=1 Tax=Clostridium formicaceticum TaxID=1497 RepID=A0AAC9RHZ6_9CLOT|nr:selenocysteine-specific translation elongation factor [Clostridium formicaceticum]AOY76884.1 selenocysteine-specific translation elongation factor [Clostridium formicaceticum]ARE87364.1 Selenocysteine-specific elongation factor [Clostridium formicaceticum]
MKNIIIGTAGHIDHGKTTLIKALTNRETDRLKEEKKRGISIELGFTYFDLPSGRRAGIIDVPGHEKFVRHMLAGAGGMDIVMLVIAADEGVMPQTKEHLDILSVLNIKKGIIVITKASLVEEEWLQLIQEDIREKVKHTFLKDAKMLVVDSVSKKGIKELIDTIDQLTDETESRDIEAPTRMPIDRVFSITGFGTVVTGTLLEGKISLEDTLEILPDNVKVRIRNIQVHGEPVEAAYAGQRVAINLANVKKEEIERGYVLAQADAMETTMMIDARINVLRDGSRKLQNRDRVRLYHGSTEIFARVVLLEKEEMQPGDSGLVQFRLEESIAVKKGDRIVVRFYSPLTTVGGAVVVDSNPKKHKRFDEKIIQELLIKEKGTPEDVLEKHIERYSNQFPDVGFLAKLTAQQVEEVQKLVIGLKEKGRVLLLNNTIILHKKHYEEIKEKTLLLLSKYHQQNPLRLGMIKEEFKNKIVPKNAGKSGDALLELLQRDKLVKVFEKYIAAYDFEISFNPTQLEIKSKIEAAYLKEPYATPKIEDVIKSISYKRQEIDQVLETMLGRELIKINSEIILHEKAYLKAKAMLIEHINKKDSISLAEFRDLLNSSRKYAVALLEYFDNIRLTKRLEDKRVLH